MSLDKLFAGWTFRTATPAFAEGDRLEAYVTGRDPDGGVQVRIGDTVLHMNDTDPRLVDALIRLRVTSFDPATNAGTAELLQVVADPE